MYKEVPRQDRHEQVIYNRRVLRLRKKRLPIWELLQGEEFESLFLEEVTKYIRTNQPTEALIGCLVRTIRPAVLAQLKRFNLSLVFDDLLQDCILLFLERKFAEYDFLRSSLVSYCQYHAWFYTRKQLREYISLESYTEELHGDMFEVDTDNRDFLYHFTQDLLPTIRWRFPEPICRWLSWFILAGVRQRKVVSVLRQTIYPDSREDAVAIYQYVLVTLRIEIYNAIERTT